MNNKQIKRNKNAIIIACINIVPNIEPLTSITNTTFFSTGWRPLGGKVMNKIATIDLDKEKGSQEAR